MGTLSIVVTSLTFCTVKSMRCAPFEYDRTSKTTCSCGCAPTRVGVTTDRVSRTTGPASHEFEASAAGREAVQVAPLRVSDRTTAGRDGVNVPVGAGADART